MYLDTDVIMQKPFDELLNQEAFIGFSCDCALCTAVVGAQKGATFIKGILEMYDTGKFYTEESLKMEKRKQSIVMENGLHQMNIGRGIQYVHIRILY